MSNSASPMAPTTPIPTPLLNTNTTPTTPTTTPTTPTTPTDKEKIKSNFITWFKKLELKYKILIIIAFICGGSTTIGLLITGIFFAEDIIDIIGDLFDF
jgi:hypothetical protein